MTEERVMEELEALGLDNFYINKIQWMDGSIIHTVTGYSGTENRSGTGDTLEKALGHFKVEVDDILSVGGFEEV